MRIPHLERESTMQHWQELLAGTLGLLLLTVLSFRYIQRRARRKQRDFTRKLETLLQPKEQIKVICPQRGGHCIVTGTRIIFEYRGQFSAFPLKDIRKLQGINDKGNRTTVPGNMKFLTVMLEKEYRLHNSGEEFLVLARLLQEKKKKPQQKK